MKLFTVQIICQIAGSASHCYRVSMHQITTHLVAAAAHSNLHTVTDKATRLFLKYNLMELTDGPVMSRSLLLTRSIV